MGGLEASCFLMSSCVLFLEEMALPRAELALKARDPQGEKLRFMCVMNMRVIEGQERTSAPRKKWEVGSLAELPACAGYAGPHRLHPVWGGRLFNLEAGFCFADPTAWVKIILRKTCVARSRCFRNLKACKSHSGGAAPSPADREYILFFSGVKSIMLFNSRGNPLS